MPRSLAFAFLLLAALSSFAAPLPTPTNLDFETGAIGEVPPGWVSPTVKLGYTGVLSAETPKQGKQSVRLSGAPISGVTEGSVFGNVMQQVDATPYRGKRVRFRGAIRVEGDSASAGLWMRVDRPAKQMGFFENMQQRPVRASDWAYYEITGDVAADAEVLNFGMILEHEGTAWLDDVTIQIAPNLVMRSAPPRAVTPRGLENLIAFTRLFGIVRYFHPSDEAAAADWNAVAIDGAVAVESAQNASELASKLAEVFLPLAPSMRIFPSDAPQKASLAKPAEAKTVVSWVHHGLGQGAVSPQESIYTSERTRRAVTDSESLQPLLLDLGGGVSASIPLAVYADATHTLPRPSREPLAHAKGEYTGNDRATRIGAVVMLWNSIQHFYPYFDVVDVDWRAELRTGLTAAATDAGEAAFLITLRKMIAALDDGHGSAFHPSLMKRASLPILWRVVGDALIVTAVDPSVTDVSLGDEVITIDGKPALQAVRETEALISGTPQWRRTIALYQVGVGDPDTPVTITIRTAGAPRTVTLERTAGAERVTEKRPEKVAELKPGFWYFDLTRAGDADFDASLAKLAAARGIIFDLRGYPRLGTKPLRHLIDTTSQSARWNIPILRRPDFQGVEWQTDGRWTLEPVEPHFTKNIVFLTDARAISYAESWMGIVEAYKLGQIVGETTAGTNGNINILQLPGGYRFIFTGMKVLKHDGSQHHGIGIAPTVPVSPTLAGIRAGKDEQLEKAIEILETKKD